MTLNIFQCIATFLSFGCVILAIALFFRVNRIGQKRLSAKLFLASKIKIPILLMTFAFILIFIERIDEAFGIEFYSGLADITLVSFYALIFLGFIIIHRII